MGIWEIFNKPAHFRIRESRHYVLDNVGKHEIDSDYADKGIAEGWLVVADMHIDTMECEHITYRLA